MSELFESEADPRTLPMPTNETLALDTSEIEWRECGSPGFWVKALFEDPNSSQKTWLMKVDAGAYSPMHTHNETEQIFVIEGTFYDQDRTYGPGDFAIRPACFPHEAGSRDGALILLVYSCPAAT